MPGTHTAYNKQYSKNINGIKLRNGEVNYENAMGKLK